MSPLPLEFPFCPSKYCHQTPFITYFSYVQDMLLSQVNRKKLHNEGNSKKKNPLYKSVDVTIFPYSLEILPPAGVLSSLSPLQGAQRGQGLSLLCQWDILYIWTFNLESVWPSVTFGIYDIQSVVKGFARSAMYKQKLMPSGPHPLSLAQQSRVLCRVSILYGMKMWKLLMPEPASKGCF